MIIGGRQDTGQERDHDRPRDRAAAATPPHGEAEELLRAVGKGDEDAFARLYDLVAPRVLGLARRVLRDPAQAEEVTQEILRRGVAHAPAGSTRPKGSATSWILTIAHRRAVDRVRSAQAGADRERRSRELADTPTTRSSRSVTATWKRSRCAAA